MTSAVVVAAGSSRRMGEDKLWLTLAGRPVVAHCLAALAKSDAVDEIVVVVRDGEQDRFAALQAGKVTAIVAGGAERQDSVCCGLAHVNPDTDVVLVHDAARPLITPALIAQVCAAAQEHGAAVCGHAVTDTLKEIDGKQFVKRTPPRHHLMAVQTPQAFRADLIRSAYELVKERGEHVTDDTAAVERLGRPVKVLNWSEPNPKVTHPGDLEWIEYLIRRQTAG